MKTELVKAPKKTVSGTTGGPILPAVIADAGEKAGKRFIEFLTATIRNGNTRQAYARAIGDFFAWCERHRLALLDIEPVHVATYIEALTKARSAPTVKQHLAAIRMCFDWLTSGGILDFNPASSVRGPKHVVKQGKTPVLTADEAKDLLASIIPEKKKQDGTDSDNDDAGEEEETQPKPTIAQLRDRALIAVMVFSFARVSAALAMKVEDYYTEGRRAWFRLHEKGGKRHKVPAHHNAEKYVDAYLDAAGIAGQKKTPLFRSIDTHRKLTDRPMDRNDALRMIKRRARAAGLPEDTCCHTFRATGITAYLEGGGTIEHAQAIANH
ncbi:MAG TPA: tyrosine-type recombinase/integrase, partial [Isosphaeraceae bacterium]|nr:tyrosine-type recombinase/integrase [Isosphaeraceae bacterium]